METLIVAAAAVVVVFIYTGSFSGPFVFDDVHNITENRRLRVTGFAPQELYAAAFESPSPNRPIANLSFVLNYAINGFNPVGYRFINVLIHIINGWLLYRVTRITLQTPAMGALRENAGTIAALAAVVWMVHPLHTQSVAYIVQRMTSLSALFYLLGMLCYARARLSAPGYRKTASMVACGAAGLLALGTKEIAATLPAFLFLYEWFFFQESDPGWLRRRLPALAAVCVLSAAVALLYIGGLNPIERILAPYSSGTLSAGQRLLTQTRVIWFYVSLLFWPSPDRLNLDHDFPFSHSLVDPVTTLPALLGLAGLGAAAIFIARRQALVSYAILWFLGNLAIESSVIRLETVFEHRTYLPSMLPAAAVAALAVSLIRNRAIPVAILSAVAILWAGWTYERAQVWGDAVLLWQDCMRKSPAKARPYNNLGSELSERGRLPEAAELFIKALSLNPDYADAVYNLGSVLVRLGRMEEGITRLLEAVGKEPDNYMAHNNLGVAYLLQEDYPAAVRQLEEALRLRPENAAAHNNLGVARRNLGDPAAAIGHFRQAIRIDPRYAEAHNNLGLALKDRGELKAAAVSFRRALEINPGYEAARANLEEIEGMLRSN